MERGGARGTRPEWRGEGGEEGVGFESLKFTAATKAKKGHFEGVQLQE